MRLRDSVSIAMRMRSSSLGSTGCITAGELLNGDLSENSDLSENLYALMRNIHGSQLTEMKQSLICLPCLEQ
uniref:Uncharacterized protein n=1 Tax=Amphimedon queenslandica TaxID=400682 RepID=A0A1X7VB48_AMPQE